LEWSGKNEFRFKVGEGLVFRVREVGRRGKLWGRGLKKPWAGEEENKNAQAGCVWVHPQNGLNNLILNWCTGGCWFTPASLLLFLTAAPH
jgi:hypothetical protein